MPVLQQLALQKYLPPATLYFTLQLGSMLHPHYEVPPAERDALRDRIRAALGDWKAARRMASKVGVSRTVQTFYDRYALWTALHEIPPNVQEDPAGAKRGEGRQVVVRDAQRLYRMMTHKEKAWMKRMYDKMTKSLSSKKA
jgi:hypothetical protein